MSADNTMHNFGSFIVEVEHGFMAFAGSREKCLETIYETIQKYETVCILKKTYTTSYHDAGGGHVIYILANSSWDDRIKQIIGAETCAGSFLFDKPEVRIMSRLEKPECKWDRDDVYMYASAPEFKLEYDEASVLRSWVRYDDDVTRIGIFTLAYIFPELRDSWSWSSNHAKEWMSSGSLKVRREYDISPVMIEEMTGISKQTLFCYRARLLSDEPENRAEQASEENEV